MSRGDYELRELKNKIISTINSMKFLPIQCILYTAVCVWGWGVSPRSNAYFGAKPKLSVFENRLDSLVNTFLGGKYFQEKW
jgi:hypothetical protein